MSIEQQPWKEQGVIHVIHGRQVGKNGITSVTFQEILEKQNAQPLEQQPLLVAPTPPAANPALTDWQGNPIPVPAKPDPNANPCIAVHGPGPEGQICKGCIHLRYPLMRSGVRYWKCDLRKLTHGRATDHKVSWPACARYEKREGEYNGG